MGRLYVCTANGVTLTTAVNGLMTISTSATEANAGGRIKIKRVEISQYGTGTSGQCRAALSKRDNAATLTVASLSTSIFPLLNGGVASAFTTNGTDGKAALQVGTTVTVDSGGTYQNLYVASFNCLNGWLYIPTPETEMTIGNTSVFVVKLLADPATLTGWNCTVIWDEF